MYSNDYDDDGALMNAYIRWSKRQTISTESEEVKAGEEFCWKCRGETADADGSAASSFPHIQDLCPADRRRIALLVKQLIKCAKEARDAKSELTVSESEKEAMRIQYEKSLDRRETEKKQLEFQLNEARGEASELKIRISRILELLTRQIAIQEKQFLELTRTVGDLAEEKSRLRNALAEKQTETDALEDEFRRTKELLEKATRSGRCKDVARMVHQACQTEEFEITTNVPSSSNVQELDKDSISCRLQNVRIKSKSDLDEPTTEGTLLRELFFRKPSVEETGSLDIIPVLSETDQQTRPTNSVLFP
ncbi:hypothetical protein K0M31_009546 [Melipona bicolor]|uniref:Uncharacterized protein n=1 Tax=Melipona bicolor TaxID=60889 RepID=A0AA40FNX5_9HYME|nr:hypothetical protein K0M31_009546 [Melipona bicolor]